MSTISQTAAPAPRAGFFTGRRLRRIQEAGLGYLFLLPAFGVLAMFQFFPVFYGFYISLCNWKVTGCFKLLTVGDYVNLGASPVASAIGSLPLGNYVRAFQDPEMWHSLLVTVTYSAISVPLQLGIALVLAYLLFQNIRGKALYRVFFFMPYITSTVASAAVWAFLYSPDKGPINAALHALGLPTFKWLNESRGIFQMAGAAAGISLPDLAAGPSLALVAIIFYTTWVFVGYDTTIFMAGLGNIPNELYEAAKIDGASGWQLFRRITIPLLSPTTFFLLIYTVIGTFKAFNHIYVMTPLEIAGDPTTTTSILIFRQMFQYNRYGYSAALSFVLFAVILALTIIQNRVAGRHVVYS